MSTTMAAFAATIAGERYLWDLPGGAKEQWGRGGLATRVSRTVLGAVNAPADLQDHVEGLIERREFIPAGRYLAATGRPFHQTNNCLLMGVEDTREAWATHMYKTAMGLMTGAGIGGVYSLLRGEGEPIRRTGGVSSGPNALIEATNDSGRKYRQGGTRRGALWAGLHWNHPDIFKFIALKNWSPEVRRLKALDVNFPAPCDMTNISVILDDLFFEAICNKSHPLHGLADSVYWQTIRQMLRTGEPGFSIDIGHPGEHLRNACTEVCSVDPDDICNLGSLNLARIRSPEHLRESIEGAMAFLVAGSVYSDVPYPEVDAVRQKNRRVGLGLMGIHEWLLTHGKKYGADAELDRYLEVYRDASDEFGDLWADRWSLSRPKGKRAIAPNGTIGIVAETTPSGDPMFCTAYKRRYAKGSMGWRYQYVIDPTADRLVKGGVNPDAIEDAYTLAENIERRVAFQAHLQGFVDQCISTTLNLPAWGSPRNNEDTVRPFGEMLLKYLPRLRGITVYPDGARDGQPLQAVRYQTAIKHIGEVFVDGGDGEVAFEAADVCDIKGGTCGA